MAPSPSALSSPSVDKDKAKTNPSSVFDKPDDVVTDKELQASAALTLPWCRYAQSQKS